ncbi:MAG: SGNH/GDSL hydrolase family protein [Gemmiger sp.]|nr:SGNH/GDSL hydrolase family protein [Gemmiger sp.]
MEKTIRWCAIGDSFTYLNDHRDEMGFRVQKGYLTRTLEKLNTPVELINLGINGSTTADWLNAPLAQAELYTILLGTNDWFHGDIPPGTKADYQNALPGTTLGNLGRLVQRIRALCATAPILVMNPVERGDFICLSDFTNTAHGSYRPAGGGTLAALAEQILQGVTGPGVETLDLHGLCGFTPGNAVHFKRVRRAGAICELPYPQFVDLPFDPVADPYPYPEAAVALTYDGLHPSDEGCEILAGLLAGRLNEILARKTNP